MTTARKRTIPPPSEGESALVKALSDFLTANKAPLRLVAEDGTEVAVPPAVQKAVIDVVHLMDQGKAITMAPHNALLTTQEAADLLDISRPTLVKLLVEGKIPYEQPGKHRRIRVEDLIEYQERFRVERREALDRMTQEAHEAGLYNLDYPFIETR
ncbi:helix-turn-helix domain-containing protein [Kibdelosporangium lantanae]|uniref:Helix-turn-helix domain-containing protein n=1 Tax=Kibdelosporangium lantanae TaxID=1497396 RepID=A0ABW3M6Q0_9PSEU